MKRIETIFGFPLISVFIFFSFLIRVNFSHIGTHVCDMNTFMAWSHRLMEMPFAQFYDSWCDYAPGYLYILWILGKLSHIVLISEVLLFKIPAIIADCITGYLIYKILYKPKDNLMGLLGSLLYLFNPAILSNSTLWGQVDSLVALCSLACLYLLDIYYVYSAIILAFGTLVKIQVAFISPIILIEMVRLKWSLAKKVKYIVISGIVYMLGFLPFFAWDKNFFLFILEKITDNARLYPYSSVNAFNIWGFYDFWKPEFLWQMICGWTIVISSSIFFTYLFYNKKNFRYLLVTLTFLTTFLFCTRLHERHLFPSFAPLIILIPVYPLLLFSYLGFSITYSANLYYALEAMYNRIVFSYSTNSLLIAFNLFLYGFLIYVVIKNPNFEDE